MKDSRKHFIKGVGAGVLLSVLLLGVILTTGCFRAARPAEVISSVTGGSGAGQYSEIEAKLDVIKSVIDNYYLNEEEIDEEALAEGIYKGFVDALNEPYTTYYTKDQYKALMESASGKYSGIGVVVTQNVQTGIVSVVRPFPGSPGEEAGIQKDDYVIKVGDHEVTDQDLNEVVSWIKGEEGTTIDIELYRPSEERYLTVTATRRIIEIQEVEYRMLDNNVGYIEILEFEELTSKQFNSAIDDLEAQGMESLIVDLRDNPGGLVDQATAILDRFLPAERLLVYTEDKNGEKDELFSEDDETFDKPFVVLINGNSASASEIVAGAIRDYDLAELVGTQSFGKGIVQYIMPLTDGSAVKVTAAKYYSPEGINIHGTGIEPDVVVEDDLDTEEDEQLEKAIEILTGK